jgi:hypothetical protein
MGIKRRARLMLVFFSETHFFFTESEKREARTKEKEKNRKSETGVRKKEKKTKITNRKKFSQVLSFLAQSTP